MGLEKWARPKPGAHGLRRGAWYAVVNEMNTAMIVLDVQKNNVPVPRDMLVFSDQAPMKWTVVQWEESQRGAERASEENDGLTYAVCPICCVFLALELRFVSLAWILGTTASGYGLSKALKVLFQRARPDLVPHLAPASGYSFPSGHSMVSAVVYFTLAFLITHSRRGRAHQICALAIAFLVTGIVGTTRVYLGVHYPSDVLAGWLAGAAWATAGWLVATTTDGVGVSSRAVAVEKK